MGQVSLHIDVAHSLGVTNYNEVDKVKQLRTLEDSLSDLPEDKVNEVLTIISNLTNENEYLKDQVAKLKLERP